MSEATARISPETDAPRHELLSRRTVLVFAVACGIAVANLYYAQPLLPAITHDLHGSAGRAGLVVTLTQLGYAAGLAFVVPLGDFLDRRRLVVIVLGASALALLAAMASPSIEVLLAVSLLIGVTSVVAQVLIPFAANLAGNEERGRVVGTVMSGLLIGVLLARTFAGIIAQVGGWRAVYGVAAVLMLALIGMLWREMPVSRAPGEQHTSYWRLLASIFSLVRDEPLLRRRSAYGALVFAEFSVFWTSMAFLLARPPFGYSQILIGLFGLAGAAGALAASFTGRLADRGLARWSTGAFLVATLLSWAVLAAGGTHLLLLIAGVIIMDLGVQGTHITNQSEIYRLRPEARSRITTVYMTTYFAGGAVGSAISAAAWAHAGWGAVCGVGALCALAGCLLWLTEFRRHQRP